MNRYDNVCLDVPKLIEEVESKSLSYTPKSSSSNKLGIFGALGTRVSLYLTAFLYKAGVYQRLIHSNLKLDWFFEFREYWVKELGNRPIEPHDFHFLLGVYRQKFQELGVSESATDSQHILAWQDPKTIYLLFAHQYALALRPLAAHRFVKYIRKNSRLCEYGCGAAPITTSLCRFYPYLNVNLTCADIPTIVFHFTQWKFRNKNHVRMVKIDPSDDKPLDSNYDLIFCQQTFEHLPRPIEVVKHLHSRTNKGGYLIFDYIRSNGEGLDTVAALHDRITVLEFIREHFDIIEGQIPLDGSNVETVVCAKK